ncbi:hypothetical protein RFI_15167, partial [Reticulomyxa filosa]
VFIVSPPFFFFFFLKKKIEMTIANKTCFMTDYHVTFPVLFICLCVRIEIEAWGFTQQDLDRKIYVGQHTQFLSLMGNTDGWVTLRNVTKRLQAVYCGSIGFQYMHIANSQKNNYLRALIERDTSKFTKQEKIRILDRLIWATELEVLFFFLKKKKKETMNKQKKKFLDVKFERQKRFGIIGSEAMVPLLKEIIDEGARLGVSDFVIGMPHRGRLTTLCTVMRKPLERILYEFREKALPWTEVGDSGDVKYHLGYSTDRYTPDEIKVHLSLVPNPSHLEAVNAVCMGKTKAKQHYKKDLHQTKTYREHILCFTYYLCNSMITQFFFFCCPVATYVCTCTLQSIRKLICTTYVYTYVYTHNPIRTYMYTYMQRIYFLLMHGDAAFAGQGNVYESMSLTELPNYTTGGVVHVIVNNQIGFTTDPSAGRSSPYCTDVGRAIAAPIFHVNGDDVEAVVRCARLAVRYRQTFQTDAIVDMVCFRRYGHNEGDEPAFTQPFMYRVIDEKMKRNDTVLEKYKAKLLKEGVVTEEVIQQMQERIVGILQDSYDKAITYEEHNAPDWLEKNWKGILGSHIQGKETSTAVTPETINKIAVALTSLPQDFNIHKRLQSILEKRKKSLEEGKGIDWGTGEALAFGSLQLEGFNIRLSGQDSERGTFSQRHSVFHEQKNISATHTARYLQLCHIPGATGEFQVSNSNLSELAVLGFEYGYSTEHPRSLVLWEAQFGDFANGAQVVFDQFVSSAETKWLRFSGLVCLLPHGYEAGGSEHSSARMERFLQCCDDDPDTLLLDSVQQLQSINWQIVNCTTPANYFHVLRRQMHRNFRKPLIVFTPKFGLRHPLTGSTLKEFCGDSKFERLIPDDGRGLQNGLAQDENIQRVIFCSGKIWIHLLDHRVKSTEKSGYLKNIALVRLEQIAPFPYDLVQEQLKKYPNAELVWAQEEPKNMGAWHYVFPRFATAAKGITNKLPVKKFLFTYNFICSKKTTLFQINTAVDLSSWCCNSSQWIPTTRQAAATRTYYDMLRDG